MSEHRATANVDLSAENLPLIRASELVQYSFCHRAWWLGVVKKVPPENQASLTRGRRLHVRHERQVQAAGRWHRLGYLLIGAGGFVLLVTLLWLWLAGI